MIRKTWDGDKWLLTPQAEHARISGLLAASWNFPGDKPHDEAVVAITRHDDGWKDADAEPGVNAEGVPVAFDEMDPLKAVEIWSRSSSQLLSEGKFYGAQMVAMHFSQLARTFNIAKMRPRAAAAIGKFLGDQKYLIAKCERELAKARDENGNSGGALDRDLRLLQVCDLLSLLLCTDFTGQTEITDVPYLTEGDKLKVGRRGDKLALTIEPLPFKKNLRDHVNGTVVPRRAYANSDDLKGAIDSGSSSPLEFHFGAQNGK